jgi:hypothetical protein
MVRRLNVAYTSYSLSWSETCKTGRAPAYIQASTFVPRPYDGVQAIKRKDVKEKPDNELGQILRFFELAQDAPDLKKPETGGHLERLQHQQREARIAD